MFLKSESGLRREHRDMVFRIRQVGDERMLGRDEGGGGAANPRRWPPQSLALGNREHPQAKQCHHSGSLEWPIYGAVVALWWVLPVNGDIASQ